MISLPPADPVLSTVHLALDGDATAEALQAHLGRRLRIEGCRPCYVRYKPTTNCVVLYDLTLRDIETGAVATTSAHATLYPEAHGRRVGSRRSLAALAHAAAQMDPERPFAHAAYVDALHAVVQFYPVDRKLRALVTASSGSEMRGRLGVALYEGQPLPRCEAVLVRYKPARRALFRYAMTGSGIDAVYGKLYADDRGRAVFHLGQALVRAGAPTPTPLAYLPDLHLVVHAEARGRRLKDLGRTAEFARWMGPAAETLARLHAIRPPALRPHSLGDEARAVVSAALGVGMLLPGLAVEACRLASRVAARLAEVEPLDGMIHGDFSGDQLLVSEGGVVVIDLDETRAGHPLIDVGTFLSYLAAESGVAGGPGDPFRAAFLDAYAARRPQAAEHAALFEAAGLLKRSHTFFRRLNPDWPQSVERLVRLADRCLDAYERGRRPLTRGLVNAAPRDRIDPALPQLEILQDPWLMGIELERAIFAEPTKVTEVAVVRHKPGRRCTLRYQAWVGPPGARRLERLYAKTFASDRGPRVYQVIAAVSASRACGPEVLVPDPVGYVPFLKMALQREVPGVPASGRLMAGDTGLAARIADALHALHASDLELERRHTLAKELGVLEDRVTRFCDASTALAWNARRCLTLVAHGWERVTGWRWRPVHRDFYHDQLLIGGHGLGILDFDDAAMSEPALDVANFLAHLTLLAAERPDVSEPLARVGTAFEARYRQLAPDLDPPLLRLLVGATLLRLAEIHLARSGGPWLAARLLVESERILRSTARTVRVGLG